VLLVIGVIYGIIAVALSQVVNMFIFVFITSYYARKYLNYKFKQQIQDGMSSVALSVLMGAILIMVSYFFEVAGVFELLLLAVVGAVCYLAGNYLFHTAAFNVALCFVKGDTRTLG